MIPVAPWTCQTPLRCLPYQPDLLLNLVHSGHSWCPPSRSSPARLAPSLRTQILPGCLVPGKAQTWPQAWLCPDSQCDPGLILLSESTALCLQNGCPLPSSKIAGLGKGISLGMIPQRSLSLAWQSSHVAGREGERSRASGPFEKYSSLCGNVWVRLPSARARGKPFNQMKENKMSSMDFVSRLSVLLAGLTFFPSWS